MKFNPITLIFVILYFSTSNWIITDYFMTPSMKNYFLGGLMFIFISFLLIKQNYKFNIGALLFSITGMTAVALNEFVYISLIFQHFFLFVLAFYFLNFKDTLSIYKSINRINYFLILLIPLQMSLYYFDQSLLLYAGPVSSTGLGLNENIEIHHWISYLGSTTNERFDFFGKDMPRFSGYLTEPSAVPNLIMLPLLIEAMHNRKKIIPHLIIIIFCVFIYRSGFVTIYTLSILILLIAQKSNLITKKYFLVISLTVALSIFFLLPSMASIYSYIGTDIFSLANKTNSLNTRTFGLLEMASEIKLFGNHYVGIYGVGIMVHYLILYGYPIIFFLGYVAYKLYQNEKFFIFYIFLFSLLFLSKGFSSIFGIVLLLSYASYKPPVSVNIGNRVNN